MRDQRQFACHIRRLLQEFAFIRDLSSIVQSQIADVVVHETRKEGDILFRQDDKPDDCYIILAGEVQVWQRKEPHCDVAPDQLPFLEGHANVRRHAESILNILRTEEAEERTAAGGQRKSYACRRGTSVARQKTAKCSAKKDTLVQKKKDIKEAVQGRESCTEWMHVVTLGPGMVIGEVGLLEDQARNATLRCNCDMEFLVIKKVDFERVLKEAMNRLRHQKLQAPIRSFLKEYEYFRNLDPEVLHQVPEIVHYVHYKQDAIIFREGELPGGAFFITLTGGVTVWRSDAPPGSEPLAAPEASRVLKMKCAAMLQRLHENEDYTHHQDWIEAEPDVDFHEFGGPVASLTCGHMFGEVSLMEDRPRNATCICSHDSEFLWIDKDALEKVLHVKMQEVSLALPSLILPLIPEVPFFQSMNKGVQENVCFAMHLVTEPAGTVLFSESDPPQDCYFVLSGTVSVSKKASEERVIGLYGQQLEQTTGGLSLCALCDQVVAALNQIEHPAHFADLVRAARALKKQQDEEQTNFLRNATQDLGLQVALLGKGSMVGVEALLADAPRNATVTCTSTCKLLILSMSDFDRVIRQELLRAKIKQLASVVRRLLREFDLMKDLEPSVQEICEKRISETVHYTHLSAGQLVFQRGDAPDFCYIILSGEVTVWMPQTGASERALHRAEKELMKLDSVEAVEEDEHHKFVRPALAPTSTQAREKCAQLAVMLGSFARQGLSTVDALVHDYKEQSAMASSHTAVATLGPGKIFGELALINDNPRNATISCWTDCEFLVIEKADFEGILKGEMKRVKERTIDFLRSVVPGVSKLPQETVNKISYFFTKESVPRNHAFFEQGDISDGSIYFIWQGSAESHHSDPQGKFTRRGIMLQGSMFAAIPQGSPAPMSVVSTSSPCEVLHVKAGDRKHLPDSVLRALKEVLDQTMARRAQQCFPLSPIGSIFEPTSPTRRSPQGSKCMLRTRSGQVPHPLSGKIPPIYARSNSDFETRMKARNRSFEKKAFPGLFDKKVTEVDYEQFELKAGETLASKAKMPTKRDQRPLNPMMIAPGHQNIPKSPTKRDQRPLNPLMIDPGHQNIPKLPPPPERSLPSLSPGFRSQSCPPGPAPKVAVQVHQVVQSFSLPALGGLK